MILMGLKGRPLFIKSVLLGYRQVTVASYFAYISYLQFCILDWLICKSDTINMKIKDESLSIYVMLKSKHHSSMNVSCNLIYT